MQKILLIDGNSLINRAFYAMPPLTDKNGEYTNAVYGFLNIFFKLIDEERPEMCAVCFDVHQPTFRHLKYAQYKGTRKSMPEELRPQIPLLKKVLSTMEIKTVELGGYEADDLLGTLAKKAEAAGISPVIVSGDRDLLQLATDTILVRIPKTKGGATVIEDYRTQQVVDTYGVTPLEFIEMKALMGDTSDNVPGVPSIGEKTAAKIIAQYKTVENAIAHSDEVKPKKAAENIKQFAEQALLSKWLVTINTDVPIDISFDETKADNMFNQNALHEFKEHNFKTFLDRFSAAAAPAPELDFKFTDSRAEAEKAVAALSGETSCNMIFENGIFEAAAVCSSNTDGILIALPERELLEVFKPFFESDIPKIMHDVKAAYVYLAKHGITLKNAVFDTMIASYLLEPNNSDHSRCGIASDYLHLDLAAEEQIYGKGKSRTGFGEAIVTQRQKITEYCCQCCRTDLDAKAPLEEEMTQKGLSSLYYDIELPLLYVLGDMELYGIRAERSGIIEYGKKIQVKIEELTKEIYWLAGEEFNINSPKQLGTILFEKLGLKGGKKTKTGWSTNADILEKLAEKDEIVGKILEYRSYAKLKSTYVDGLLAVISDDGKIHSTFNQTIAATGRISSTEPNLQNIPIKTELGRQLRKVFLPEDGYVFLDGDYSQIELCLLAHLSGDETLISAFKNGRDIHRLTASQVFNVPFEEVTPLQRSNAKAVNFGIIYGMGAFSLSRDLGITKAEAENYIQGYFAKYPKVKEYLDGCVEFAKKNGYAKTAYNRIRYIPELTNSNFNLRSFGERVAMNMPIQGTAADIIKIAMLRVHNALKGHKSRLILQVHDELLLEVHRSELEEVRSILMREMSGAAELSVPLVVDAHEGENWYDAK